MALKPGEMDRHIQRRWRRWPVLRRRRGFLYVFDKDGARRAPMPAGTWQRWPPPDSTHAPEPRADRIKRLRRGESVVWPAAELATVTVATPFTGENDDRGFIGLLHAANPSRSGGKKISACCV
jgi:hypothetical protein